MKSRKKMINLTRDMDAPTMVNSSPIFPTLFLDGGSELADIPESGTMVVKFKRSSLSVSKREDETRVNVALEIPCICEIMPGPKEERESKSEDVLDALLKEAVSESEERDEDESDADEEYEERD